MRNANLKSMMDSSPKNEPLVIHFDVNNILKNDGEGIVQSESQTPKMASFQENKDMYFKSKDKQPKTKAELFELRKQMVK